VEGARTGPFLSPHTLPPPHLFEGVVGAPADKHVAVARLPVQVPRRRRPVAVAVAVASTPGVEVVPDVAQFQIPPRPGPGSGVGVGVGEAAGGAFAGGRDSLEGEGGLAHVGAHDVAAAGDEVARLPLGARLQAQAERRGWEENFGAGAGEGEVTRRCAGRYTVGGGRWAVGFTSDGLSWTPPPPHPPLSAHHCIHLEVVVEVFPAHRPHHRHLRVARVLAPDVEPLQGGSGSGEKYVRCVASTQACRSRASPSLSAQPSAESTVVCLVPGRARRCTCGPNRPETPPWWRRR